MLKTIIIEDEENAQQLLSNIIENYCPNLQLVGMASSLKDSIHLINSVKPDVVFLDIELEDTNAFEILEYTNYLDFKIIFTTAYQEFAIKAFEVEAIDYILKPYSPKSIVKAVSKIIIDKYDSILLNKLKSSMGLSNQFLSKRKLSIKTLDGIILLDIDDIVRLEADGSYCTIYYMDNKNCLSSKTLKYIENQLPKNLFFRSHIKHLVNINHVAQFKNEDGGYVIMTNEDIVPVSRRKRQNLIDILTSQS